MQVQSFYQLPRVIQDRFIAAADGQTLPTPILRAEAAAPNIPRVWIGLAAAALFALCVTLSLGYGNLEHSLAISPLYMSGVYSGLMLVFGLCAHVGFWSYQSVKKAPHPRGRYLFPSGLIDSTKADFRIWPITELTSVEVVGTSNVLLRFERGNTETFSCETWDIAQAAQQQILAAQEEWREKQQRGAELTLLDPLREPRYSNPLSTRQSHRAPSAVATRVALPVVALLTLPLAYGLLSVRNVLSERRLFTRALEQNSVEGYSAYLQKSDKHPEVASLLLPRAQLAKLIATDGADALEQFLAANLDSPIRPEIEAPLRTRLLAELETARRDETLSAIDAFGKRRVASAFLVQNELMVARKALLQRSLDRFAPRAAATPGLLPFMEATFAYVALHGPRFEVRFQRVMPASVKRADETVRTDPDFQADQVPSQYFDEQHVEQWLAKVFQHVYHGFGLAFPTDALAVERGEWLPANEDLPAHANPSLLISYSTNMGSGIRNRNPNGIFFGVGIQVKARLVHPSAEAVEMRFAQWTPPDLLKLREGKWTPAQVYENMAETTFKAFDRRLAGWLFKRDFSALSPAQ